MSLEISPKMKVKDVMTTEVISIKEDQSRQQAARLLSKHRISGLPVVDEDNILLGVVTEYDIISKKGKTVKDIMTSGVISVGADTDLEEASHILVNERIRRLPVVDKGRVIGIVSRSDLVKEIATRWVCQVCGEVMRSDEQPESCQFCGAVTVASSSDPAPPGS